VLIEKARTVVTDGTGQYRIVDLPAGTYTVTFTLAGFATVKREGIRLTGSFTASVNAQLSLGALEETVTVTGESPIVDVQGSKVQQTIDDETIAVIPNARQYFSFTALVPGINIQGADVGGSSGPTFSVFQSHGGRRNEGRLQVDGTEVAFLGVSFYVADTGAAQEIALTVSGGMGEAVTGGPIMNVVSRSGGNTFRGSLFANFANDSMQSDVLGGVRHGRPQHEGGLRVHAIQAALRRELQQRPAARVPLSRWRAEPAHDDGDSREHLEHDDHARRLRGRSLDVRPPDGPGRAPLRAHRRVVC
jgi:hypothetical protein